MKAKVSQAMTAEQIANYARELMNSQSELETYLGSEIWDAIYTARDRASSAIRCLSGHRGRSAEMDTFIDSIIKRIRGEK